MQSEYRSILQSAEKSHFRDYCTYTDKEISLHAEHTLSLVPFLDGLYIQSPEKVRLTINYQVWLMIIIFLVTGFVLLRKK